MARASAACCKVLVGVAVGKKICVTVGKNNLSRLVKKFVTVGVHSAGRDERAEGGFTGSNSMTSESGSAT